MGPDSFFCFNDLIKDHNIFREAPLQNQLLVLLKYLGFQGNYATNKSIATHFRISTGTSELFREPDYTVVLSLVLQAHRCPIPEERKTISERIQYAWLLPNCIGLMDGTLLSLETRPEKHGETYYTIKGVMTCRC